MKKKRLDDFPHRGRWSQILLRMKLTFVLVFCMLVQTFAAVNAQTVTLKKQNASLEEIIWELKEQTKFVFLYSSADIATVKGIDIDMQNSQIDAILKKCLEGTDLQFVKENNAIIIRQANGKTAVPQVQSRKITGKVIDEDGNPLPGVAVLIEGTTIGVATDMDGKYDLTCPEMKDIVLKFSYIGMKPKSVVVGNKTVVDVTLESDSQEMDEVVVTGLLNRRKSGFAGTTTVISKQELAKVSTGNIFTTISTLDAGFKIEENNLDGSNPNKLPDFTIRGKGSFQNGSTAPIFILDGFEVTSQKVFDMDINRIESITLLKDASATILYGSRASNGVIVIETTAPKAGKLRVTYDFKPTIAIVDLTDYDLMNAREKLQYEKEAGLYTQEITPGYEDNDRREQVELDKAYYNRYKNIVEGVNTYWLSKPLRTAFKHTHSLYLGGGNENSRYGININYGNNPGVMKGSKRDRLGLSFTWNYTISQKLRIGNMLSVDQNNTEESPYGNFSKYTEVNPYERAYDEMGRCIKRLSNGEANPVFDATLNNVNKSKSTSFNDNFDFEWYIVEGIRLTGRFAYTYGTTHSDVFVSPKSSQFEDQQDDKDKGSYDYSSSSTHSMDGNIVVNAWKSIDKHMFTLVLGANMQDNKEDNKSFSATGFLSDKLTNLDFAMQYREGAKPRGSVSQDRLIGFFANASYAYDNRYLFDFSYRTDGSSKFGKKNRFAPFWSAGIGWNIHNEKFWGNPEWLTQAKIRSSVGYTGNVTFSPYQAQTTYQYSSDNIYLNGVGADIIALGNEDLKWQRKFTVNLGCDLDFWEGRFSLTGEYFREYTKDVLMDISLPPSLGFIDYKENFGEMENKGWSLNLRTQMLRDTERELYWSLAFGTSDSKNKIKKITDKLGAMNDENNKNETKKPVPLYEEGESLDALKAVPSLGIDPETGKEVFVKKDGSLTTIWDYNDKVVCGTTDPKFRGTLNSFLTFKGISLNMSFNFQWGGQTYNQTLASRVEGVNPNSNCDRRVLYDRWKKPGDRTFFKNIALEENVSNLTTRFVQDYNYFQIGSISLGYEMRRELCRKIGLTGLRFNFNMGDIARFSSVKEERGLSYPFARQFTFSLSASL